MRDPSTSPSSTADTRFHRIENFDATESIPEGYFDATESIPEGYREIDFVCRKECGCLLRPATIDTICRIVSRKVPELEGFHFHLLRHTYTTNLLLNGAKPKDVQELLGHSDVPCKQGILLNILSPLQRTTLTNIFAPPSSLRRLPSASSPAQLRSADFSSSGPPSQ